MNYNDKNKNKSLQGITSKIHRVSDTYKPPIYGHISHEERERIIREETIKMNKQSRLFKKSIDKSANRKKIIESVQKPKSIRRKESIEHFTNPGPILFSVEDPLYTNKFISTEVLDNVSSSDTKQGFRKYIENKKEQERIESEIGVSDDLLSTNNYLVNNKFSYNDSIKEFINTTTGEVVEANGRYYKERRTVVNIDSRDRNISEFPNISNFNVNFGRSYNNVKSIRLISTEFPNSDQIIRSFPPTQRNNVIRWESWDDNHLRIVHFDSIGITEFKVIVLEDPTTFLKIGDQVLMTNVTFSKQIQTIVNMVPPNTISGIYDNTIPYDISGTRYGWMLILDNIDNVDFLTSALSARLFGPLSDLNIEQKMYNEVERPMYTTNIVSGNYLLDGMEQEIARAMNSITRLFDGKLHNFDISMDPDTDIITFSQYDYIDAPNSISTTAGSEILTISLPDHNLLSNDCIMICGVNDIGGITGSTINNKSYAVTSLGPITFAGNPSTIYDNTKFVISTTVIANTTVTNGGGDFVKIGICRKFKLFFDYQDKHICSDLDRNITPYNRIGFLEENTKYPTWSDFVFSSDINPARVLNRVPGTINSIAHGLTNDDSINIGANSGIIIPPPRGLRQVCNASDDYFTLYNYVTVSANGGPDPPIIEYHIPNKTPISTNAGQILSITVTSDIPPYTCIITTTSDHRLLGTHTVGVSESAVFGPITDPESRPYPYTHNIKVKISGTEYTDKNTCQKSNIDGIYELSTTDILTTTTFQITLNKPNLIQRPVGFISSWATNKINIRVFSAFDYKSETVTVFSHSLQPGNRLQIYRCKSVGGIHDKYINTNHPDTKLNFHLVMGVSPPFSISGVDFGQNTDIQILLDSFPTVSVLDGGDQMEISSHVHGFFGEIQNKNIKGVIDRPIRLEGDDYVFLVIKGLETVENAQGINKEVFAKILLSDLPGSIIFDSFVSNPKTFDISLLRNIEKIELKILTRDGFEYEFFHNDFSIGLEISEYIDVLERSNLNSLSGRSDKTSFSKAI